MFHTATGAWGWVDTRNASVPVTTVQRFAEAMLEGKCIMYIPLACRLRQTPNACSARCCGYRVSFPVNRPKDLQQACRTHSCSSCITYQWWCKCHKSHTPQNSHIVHSRFIPTPYRRYRSQTVCSHSWHLPLAKGTKTDDGCALHVQTATSIDII